MPATTPGTSDNEQRAPQPPDILTPVYEMKAQLFKALGHPVRIRTLELLATGAQPVSALLADMEIEASHLSQHLAVLRRAQVVTTERSGNVVTYTLADPCLADLLDAARLFLLHRLTTTSTALAGLTSEPGLTSEAGLADEGAAK